MSRIKSPIVEPIMARISLAGPPGGGKSWTAMKLATALVAPIGGKVGGICTERGSLKKIHRPRGPFTFDVIELDSPSLTDYVSAIKEFSAARYDALVIDSFSHAWDALLNKVGKRGKQGWGDVRPDEAELWDTVLRYPGHILCTLRVKTQMQEIEENGKKRVQKVQGEVKQREGTEYEFDVCLRVEDSGAECTVEKSRCEAIRGKRFAHAGEELVDLMRPWLDAGAHAGDAAALDAALATIAELRALAHASWHAQIDRNVAACGRNVRLVTTEALKLEQALRDQAVLPRDWKPGASRPTAAAAPPSAPAPQPSSSPTPPSSSVPTAPPSSSPSDAPGGASTAAAISSSPPSSGTPVGGHECPTTPTAPASSGPPASPAPTPPPATPSSASSSSPSAPASTSASSTPKPSTAPGGPSGLRKPGPKKAT